ncbi:hypothetical protein AX15_005276 [Amanita polypyramis BW_CC]|nr:hypothetical protein AX15_005276 [Amanita polypyramis BW_CC]
MAYAYTSSSLSRRRVHFSDNCLTFAPITTVANLRTPSPTHSDSSAQSGEDDPPTPPPLQYVPSPYPFTHAALLTSPASSSGQGISLSPPPQFPTPMPLGMGLPVPTPSPPHTHPHHQQGAKASQMMNVHYLIAYFPHSASPLQYNLLHPPQNSLLPYQPHQPHQLELDQPATEPPLTQMFITCPFLPEKWQILVVPGAGRTSVGGMEGIFSPASTVYSPLYGSSDEIPGQTQGYISILDVLYALYTSLRVIIHPSEYESLTCTSTPTSTAPSSSYFSKESVNAAFWARLSQIDNPTKREEQRRRGVRRIDFLGDRTKFLGLSGTLKGNVWELEVVEAGNSSKR